MRFGGLIGLECDLGTRILSSPGNSIVQPSLRTIKLKYCLSSPSLKKYFLIGINTYNKKIYVALSIFMMLYN